MSGVSQAMRSVSPTGQLRIWTSQAIGALIVCGAGLALWLQGASAQVPRYEPVDGNKSIRWTAIEPAARPGVPKSVIKLTQTRSTEPPSEYVHPPIPWQPATKQPTAEPARPSEQLLMPETVQPAPVGPLLSPWRASHSGILAQLRLLEGRWPGAWPPCDPNLPAIPCPSPQDLDDYTKYVKEVLDPKNTLSVITGRTRLMVFKETPKRIQIGDEKIVDYTLLANNQLSLLGHNQGSTVLTLWFTDPANKNREKIISYLVRVIPDPDAKARLELRYRVLAAEIAQAFPDSRVSLALVGDKLVVSGQVKDIADATQILRIVRANAPGHVPGKTPVDNLSSTAPTGALADAAKGLSDLAGPNVINLLRIPGEQQIMLRVTVAEVNRAAARSIGLNFNSTSGGNSFANRTGNIATGGLARGGLAAVPLAGAGIASAGLLGNSSRFGLATNNLPVGLDNGQTTLAINALRNLNYARSLAEPNLVTLNGQTANFHAGGQFPVPVISGATSLGLQGVNFVPFGVQLSFTPYITDRDRVRLSISAEVSTRDLAAGTTINGSGVSGLSTRNFQTTVELREGQTLAVAGLIQNNIAADSSRIPFLGNLPILGRALGFDKLDAGEQELVVLITPELVHPLNRDEVPPLPGSDLFEPSDLEFYLLGRLESRRSYDFRSPVMTDSARIRRYNRCEQLYMFGPTGHSEQPNSNGK